MEDDIRPPLFEELTFKFIRDGNATITMQNPSDQRIINFLPVQYRLKNPRGIDIKARITNLSRKVRVQSTATRGGQLVGTLSKVDGDQIAIQKDNQSLTFNDWDVYSEDIIGIKSEDFILNLAKSRNDTIFLECILTEKMKWDCELHINEDFNTIWAAIEARIPKDSDFVPIFFTGGSFEFVDNRPPYITSIVTLANDDRRGSIVPGSNIRCFLFNDIKPKITVSARHYLDGHGITDIIIRYNTFTDIPTCTLHYKGVPIGVHNAVKAKQDVLFKIENYFDADTITYNLKSPYSDDNQYYFDITNIRFNSSVDDLLVTLVFQLAEGQKITDIVRLMGSTESTSIDYYDKGTTIEIDYEPKKSRGVQNLRFYYILG